MNFLNIDFISYQGNKMKLKMLALVFCLFMPFQFASADIAADFKAGMNITTVMIKALTEGMKIEDIVTDMITEYPEMVTLIVRAAVRASPKKSGRIVAAAYELVPQYKDSIAYAAIFAGAKAIDTTLATAVGITASVERISTTLSADDSGNVASPN